MKFFATIIEQLDFALEQVHLEEVDYARFGFILIDNANELIMNQIAENKKSLNWYLKDYRNKKIAENAIKNGFDTKVKFARIEGNIKKKTGESIKALHKLRNEIHHTGIKHEYAIGDLARFYFNITCDLAYSCTPFCYQILERDQLPVRARKYFKNNCGDRDYEHFKRACIVLKRNSGYSLIHFRKALANNMEKFIEEQDQCISHISEALRCARDKAVIEIQAHGIAFSPQEKGFAEKNELLREQFIRKQSMIKNKNVPITKDPVDSWKRRLKKLRSCKCPHVALACYSSFYESTADFREIMKEASAGIGGVEDMEADRQRGK